MKASTIKYGVLTATLSLISVILALLPFHAFLTVWASTFVDHYTALRLWKEVLAVLAGLGAIYLLCFDRKVREYTVKRKLTWIILAYVAVQLIWALFAYFQGTVNLKAALYGVLLNSRFVLFFFITWVVAIRTDRLEQRWPKLLLWPAVIVVVFGLAQVFLLPPDFLRHFGYGPATIGPIETINSNSDYLRYMSTLRGANPLGAYLILPISALTVLLLRYPRSWNWTKVLLLVGCLALLVFTFSRSAWIGAMLSILSAMIIVWGRWLQRYRWLVAGGLAVLVLAAGSLAYGLRNDTSFQNFFLHTQDNSVVVTTSNDGHISGTVDGVKDIAQNPLGHGPGSAGPASVYNANAGRIAENYYIQIGQETGVIGLALFMTILGTVAYLLWTRRYTPLALTLFVALIGISFVNLLSHAWTDDTLAYLWWGFAGLAVGTPVAKRLKSAASSTSPSLSGSSSK